MTKLVEITAWDESGMVADLTGATETVTTEVWNGVGDGDLVYPGICGGLLEAWARPGRLVLGVDGPLTTRLFINKLRPMVEADHGLGFELDLLGAGSVLDGLTLVPEPDLPISAQSKESATIKGPAVQTIEQVIRQTVATAGVPIVVAPGSASTTQTVRIEANWAELGKTLREAAETVGLAINARIYLPGDDLPTGVSVPIGGVIVTVDTARERRWVSWQDSELPSGTVELTEATAGVGITETEETYVPGNDPNETETRKRYGTITDSAAASQLGQWAGLQVKLDATDADDPDDNPAMQMREYRESTAAEAEAPEGGPFYLGEDYQLGDEVTVSIGGVEATAVVTEVEQKIDLGSATLTPKIGDPVLPPDEAVIQHLLKGR